MRLDAIERSISETIRDDGTIAARGFTRGGLPCGYWEWFRRDGSLQRSGYFEDAKPISIWTEYDEAERPQKTTNADQGGSVGLIAFMPAHM